MFKSNNVKYRYLVDSIESLNENKKLEMWRKLGVSFGEYNVFSIGGGRQTGKTVAMKKNFDPSKDIYIAPRRNQVDDFLRDSVSIDSGCILHSWSSEALKQIKSRNAAVSCGYNNGEEFCKRVLSALKENSVIYIDVFSIEIPSNYVYVKMLIDYLDQIHKEDKFNTTRVYVVTT